MRTFADPVVLAEREESARLHRVACESTFDQSVADARCRLEVCAEDGACFAEALNEIDGNARGLFADAFALLLKGNRDEAAVCAIDAMIEFRKELKRHAAHEQAMFCSYSAKDILEAM
ncbi:MAG: hypothetical protein ACRDAM_06965 [Casimicrobium sp.]